MRVSFQQKILGNMPFYMMPLLYNSPPYNTYDGLGGARSLRGILRNRLVGEGYLFGNLECRYRFFNLTIWKQHIYFAVSSFFDSGRVTRQFSFPKNNLLDEAKTYLAKGRKETFHHTAGIGLHLAINENFVLTGNFGKPFNKQDGYGGVYFNMNYLF